MKIKKAQPVPTINFKQRGSIHYDKRTYTLKDDVLSLFTTTGRIACTFQLGDFQKTYLHDDVIKEAELVCKRNKWFFNIVLDIPNVSPPAEGGIVAIDSGENNIATTSKGTIYSGTILRHERDIFLARRKVLQSNSSQRCLQRISGRE